MRLLRSIGALLLLAALLVGVPAALLIWGHLAGLLQVDWSRALWRPDDGRITLGLLTLIGWFAWAALAATTAVELVGFLSRGAVELRLPGTGWLRPAVGALVATAVAPLLGPGAAPPTTVPLAAALAPSEAAESPADEAAPGGVGYVVAPGDELWSLAERFLGSGDRWREIVAVNPGMSHDGHLRAGERIRLPHNTPPDTSPEVGGSVTVVPGDTLWDLSEEHLGEATRWQELHEANRALIQDPDRIEVGWELLIPGSEAAPAAPSGAPPPILEPTPEVEDPQTEPDPVPTRQPANSPPVAGQQAPPARAHEDVLGPIGAVLAASILAGVAARRRTQLLQRGVGRRLVAVRPELQRFWSSLTRRGARAQPPGEVGPTGVVLGWRDGHDVVADLEASRCTLVRGSPEDALSALSAMLTSLMCAPWSTSVDVVAVQSPDDWGKSLDEPRIQQVDSLEEGLVELQQRCAARRIEMGRETLEAMRADADLASAWAPLVFLFTTPVAPAALARIRDCLDLGRVGVCVVAAAPAAPALHERWDVVQVESPDLARRAPGGQEFVPQLLDAPARHALMELFAAANSSTTEPAPWWDEDPLPPNVKVLPRKAPEPSKDTAMSAGSPIPEHPTLLLLGPVELSGCAGPEPARSAAASVEVCAWLLSNPGSTPTRMARELMVAETTRRSNVSRLRSWLGVDPTGQPYLPDGYSGRLELHPEIESDWERFQLLLSGGVNRATSPILEEALGLVRGEPLEGVAFQWPWAEQLRTDMVSMISDAATVLADRAIDDGDVPTARWAIERGRLAVGQDETLSVREIQLLALTGQRVRLDQAVRQLTRAARAAGTDLSEDSIRRIQQALHRAVSGQQAN